MKETAKDIADNLIKRAMTLKLFLIERKVGNNWLPKGSAPFNIKAKNGTATFEVYAVSEKEADDIVTKFLNKESNNE